ncbi:hypothetical protein C5167_049085 [Papaver somniferum]|uniref:Uncharacterized protein n=1 Tax=Papaver somniferum TaxID=3469 RepID=A0A4Y7KNU0_PAPSO|nr:hypothetical protein C5167_049085 [Papaver somniferum]
MLVSNKKSKLKAKLNSKVTKSPGRAQVRSVGNRFSTLQDDTVQDGSDSNEQDYMVTHNGQQSKTEKRHKNAMVNEDNGDGRNTRQLHAGTINEANCKIMGRNNGKALIVQVVV